MSRLTRRQLIAFLLVTVLSLAVMAVKVVQVPQMMGIERYEVSVDLAATGGLYPKADVTYRGADVGRVTAVALHDGGVRATLSIDDGIQIPVDSIAEVHSASAIGELYIDFVPRGERSAYLEDGDVVPVGRTRLPTPTGDVLDSVDDLLRSVPLHALRRTVTEVGRTFAGRGQDMGRILDAASQLQTSADHNLPATRQLLRDLRTVLGTQRTLRRQIRGSFAHLASLSATAAQHDGSIRGILSTGPGALDSSSSLLGEIDQPLHQLLIDLSSTSQVLNVYLPGIEHALIIVPPMVEAGLAAISTVKTVNGYPEGALSFRTNFGEPPVCTAGYPEAAHHRSAADLSPAAIESSSWCKVPHQAPVVVRGARNDPCPNDPTRRAATAAGCGLVFQRTEAMRQKTLTAGSTTYDPATGRLLAPNGRFYLVDQATRSSPAATWQDYLMDLMG